jgi:probable F420-dependent oxidoreductase
MHYGIAIFPTDYAMAPDELGRACEERGMESLWVAEHTHIPCSRETPWPGGAELPKVYYDTLEPFMALTAAAVATKKLKLATGISLVIQHHPINLAKQVATLDQISGGRVLFGVGGGWNREEIANHGTEFDSRFKLLRESVEAMKVIWTEDEAAYHGDLVDFDPIFQWPKPVQKPHPPVHVGGGAPYGLRRAVRYGNGWMPIFTRVGTDWKEHRRNLDAAAAEAGRGDEHLELTVYGAPPDADALASMRDAGVDRAVFAVPSKAADELLPILDRCTKAAQTAGG